MSTSRRLFNYALEHKLLVLGILFFLILGTLAELGLPLILKEVIDSIIKPNDQTLNYLYLLAFIYVIFLVINLGSTFVQLITTSNLGQKIMHKIRISLLGHSLSRSLKFLQKNPTGKLVTRLTNDVETINEFFTSVLTSLFKDLAIMLGIIIILLTMNPILAAIALLSAVPIVILSIIFRPWYKRAFRTIRLMVSKMNTFLSEHLSGMHVIQSFVKQKQVKTKFQGENDDLKKASLQEMYVFTYFRPLVDLIGTFTIAIIIYFGSGLYKDGLLSLGLLTAFISYIQKFFEPILDISDKFNIMQSAMAGAERVFESLDIDEKIKDEGTYSPEKIRGEISFENLWFSYKENEPVLKDFNLFIPAGKKIAIVGYTGAGKTTLTNIITRLWEIDSGRVSLDGKDIREYSLSSLRNAVIPVTQEIIMFADTIRANICMGKTMSDEEIWSYLEQAQAKDMVLRLELGLDTEIYENGSNFSLGERQLLHLARIIAQNPPVIIMDEATSSIDSETESKIQMAIENVTKGKTSIIIAHRLSTIRNADLIVVLSGGQVAESGSHDDLIKKAGLYAFLYDLQFKTNV